MARSEITVQTIDGLYVNGLEKRIVHRASVSNTSGILPTYGQLMKVETNPTDTTQLKVNKGAILVDGLLISVNTAFTFPIGTIANNTKCIVVMEGNLANDGAGVDVKIIKGTTTDYPTLTKNSMINATSGIYQEELCRGVANGSTLSQISYANVTYLKANWGEEINANTKQIATNTASIANLANNKVDNATLANYVQRKLSGTNLFIDFGRWNGNNAYPLFLQSYINSSNENTLRLYQTFPEGETGIYITPSFVNHISNGVAQTFAYKSDLSGKVSKAIGDSSKSVTIGETTGGMVDMQIYHDMAKENMILRRITGDDYHGMYTNEADGNLYIYTGNKANTKRLARGEELTGKVSKAIGDLAKTVVIGENSGGNADMIIAHDTNAENFVMRRVTGADFHGLYVNENDGNLYIYTGNKSNTTRLARSEELANKVSKAIGDSSKSVTIGETTGNLADFQVYHDMANENLAVRRITGADYHGFYSNENDGHLYVYLGNKADARQIANSVDLLSYVKRVDTGTNLNVRLGSWNGGTSAPFFVQAYVNSQNKYTVKLINTTPKGEQGIYINEGSVSHIDSGTAKALAYQSDVDKKANTTDLGNYVEKDEVGTDLFVRLGSFNGGSTAPFYARGYIANSKYATKLINTTPKGEQGISTTEGVVYHIDSGTAKALAYDSDVTKELNKKLDLTGGTLTGVVTSNKNIETSAVVKGGSVVAENGAVYSEGTATGFVQNGVSRTSAQDLIVAYDSAGKRRALLRSDTDSSGIINLLGYDSGGSTPNKGLYVNNTTFNHVTTSGNRALMHKDEMATYLDPIKDSVADLDTKLTALTKRVTALESKTLRTSEVYQAEEEESITDVLIKKLDAIEKAVAEQEKQSYAELLASEKQQNNGGIE